MLVVRTPFFIHRSTSVCVRQRNNSTFANEAGVFNGFQREMGRSQCLPWSDLASPLYSVRSTRSASFFSCLSVSGRHTVLSLFTFVYKRRFVADESRCSPALADEPSANATFARSARGRIRSRSRFRGNQNRTSRRAGVSCFRMSRSWRLVC